MGGVIGGGLLFSLLPRCIIILFEIKIDCIFIFDRHLNCEQSVIFDNHQLIYVDTSSHMRTIFLFSEQTDFVVECFYLIK